MDKPIIAGVLVTAFAMTASGCLVVSGRSSHESGVRITDSTMRQIEVGHTTETWVVAALGEPTCRTKLDDHTVLSRYEHCETQSEGGAVFLIFAGGSETTKRSTTYFEYTDGVLSRTWSETGTN